MLHSEFRRNRPTRLSVAPAMMPAFEVGLWLCTELPQFRWELRRRRRRVVAVKRRVLVKVGQCEVTAVDRERCEVTVERRRP